MSGEKGVTPATEDDKSKSKIFLKLKYSHFSFLSLSSYK